jgi:sodium-dependent dicarboxylate transporter 2/3/5
MNLLKTKSMMLWMGPLVACLIGLGVSVLIEPTQGVDANLAGWTAGVTVLCAFWWITEPIPIPVTALIPMVVFPITGVLSELDVAASYGHHLVLLFFSGFILSKAMEKSGAHRRLALGMVRIAGGGGGRRLVLGFMMAAAFLSMWISNTAAALMLLPVVLAVIEQSREKELAVPLLLGVAYGASIGGMGTPIGTPANAIFLAQCEELVRSGQLESSRSFLGWMALGVPVVICMLPLAWLWLTRNLVTQEELAIPESGKWTSAEVRILTVFGVTALLWMTRKEPFGGWSELIGNSSIKDSTVGLAAVVVLFLVPSGGSSRERLLDWETAVKIPWGILILFGGGITIAKGFSSSGLALVLAQEMGGLAGLPVLLMIVAISLMMTFMTEVTSNTATATLVVPLMAAVALGAGIRPELLMAPAALSASCAFMLPVATPPNAIVFSQGCITVKQMAREGLVLNLVGVVVISFFCWVFLS